MCGIAGFIGKRELEQGRIELTLEKMRNRGPDYQDVRFFEQGGNRIALLHSRLSIIDLDERSNQPFTIDKCTVAFNGEIYNYLELREELLKDGVSLRTDSDTEVLLQFYLKYGEQCVDYFEGMWSFAIFDERKGTLFLSRDRFAEKPLYYLELDGGIYFGSEIKFIESLSGYSASINKQQVFRYLVNGYKSLYKQPETFLEDIKELPYASCMTIGGDLKSEIRAYWKPEFTERKMSLDEAIEGTRHHLLESIKLRLRSDVPMAFCLSGGIDSSAIVSIAAKRFNYNVATFSIIDGDERYNELDNVLATVNDLGCRNTRIEISPEGTLERLRKLVEYHDVPIATISYLIHSMLSEKIAKQGFRVVASGTAADELFTGYYDHYNLQLYELRNHPDYQVYLNDWQEHLGPIVRNPYLKQPELYSGQPEFRKHIYLNNDIFASYLKEDFREDFFETEFPGASLLRKRMLNELFHEAIPVILHEDDLNSMLYSIENRSPYLDRKLFDFAYSIPPEHLIKDGFNKYPLRQAVRGILNDKVRLDRRKKGFNASINSLVDFSEPSTRDYLLDESSPVFEIIRRDKVMEAMETNPMPNSFSKFMFYFINVKMFMEMRKR